MEGVCKKKDLVTVKSNLVFLGKLAAGLQSSGEHGRVPRCWAAGEKPWLGMTGNRWMMCQHLPHGKYC